MADTVAYQVHSTLEGDEFEEEFLEAVHSHLSLMDEVGNIVSYTVENGVAQVYWFDGLHTVFVEDEDDMEVPFWYGA